MYHKVFINNLEVVITNSALPQYLQVPVFASINKFYQFLAENEAVKNAEKIAVLDVDGTFWKAFKNDHKLIDAAGGVVLNAENELLVIHRLGFWDLPKGKLEKGELPEEGAQREVEEECGISGLEIVETLPETFHTYELKGKTILKRTFWFLMRYNGSQKLTPQTEENITQVLFMPKNDVERIALPNTYASLKPLFNAYLLRNK